MTQTAAYDEVGRLLPGSGTAPCAGVACTLDLHGSRPSTSVSPDVPPVTASGRLMIARVLHRLSVAVAVLLSVGMTLPVMAACSSLEGTNDEKACAKSARVALEALDASDLGWIVSEVRGVEMIPACDSGDFIYSVGPSMP
jgi:hypothetical protein